MDQWSSAAGTYGQQQGTYGQQQAAAQPAAYNYPQQTQSQQPPAAAAAAAAAAPYTYTGTTYGQQGYSQQSYNQQAYSQPEQAAAAGAVTQQGGYGTGGTAGYGTAATGQQQAAVSQPAPWAQGSTATANPAAVAADASQGQAYGSSARGAAASSGAANVSGQYGGQYGSVYGAATAQGGSQQVAAASDYATAARGSAGYDSAERSSQQGAAATYGPGSQYDASAYSTAAAGQPAYDAAAYNASAGQSGYAKEGDQYGSGYGAKSTEYGAAKTAEYGVAAGQQERASYSQAGYGQETQARYPDAGAGQRQDYQDQQQAMYRQQQAQQAQPQQAAQARSAATGPTVGGARGAAADYGGAGRQGPQVGPGGPYGQPQAGHTRGPGFPAGSVYGAMAVAQHQQAAQFVAASRNIAMAQQAALSAGGGRGFGPGMGYGQQQHQQQAGFGGPPPGGFGSMGGRDYTSGRLSGPPQREGGFPGPRLGDRGGPPRGFDDRREDRPSYRRDSDRGREDDRRRDRVDSRDRDKDRDRDRDRDRGKEDDRRRDGRDRRETESRDRKDEPSLKRDDRRKEFSPPPKREQRHTSPRERETRRSYLCKIEPYSFTDPVRDYLSISRRHSKMYVVPEFSKVVACWVGKGLQLPIDRPISFEHEAVDVEDDSDNKETTANSSDKMLAPAKGSTVWNAKVLLMTGIDEAALNELEQDKPSEEKPLHVHNLLKFLAVRKDRNPIMAVGGPWDGKLDGGDPAVGDEALIRTAIRWTKENTGLDLSGCKIWNRFIEVHYERAGEDGSPHHQEATVMFLPDISNIIPSLEEWKGQWRERLLAKKAKEQASKEEEEAAAKANSDEKVKEKEAASEEAATNGDGPKDDGKPSEAATDKSPTKDLKIIDEKEPTLPGLIVTTKRTSSLKMRSMSISLDGLLDYDEEDREDITFELSLFAENFHEYLQTEAGSLILANLNAVRQVALQRKKEDKKRSLEKSRKEAEVDKGGESQAPRKRTKFSDTADVPKAEGEEHKDGQDTAPENGAAVTVKTEEDKPEGKELALEDAAVEDSGVVKKEGGVPGEEEKEEGGETGAKVDVEMKESEVEKATVNGEGELAKDSTQDGDVAEDLTAAEGAAKKEQVTEEDVMKEDAKTQEDVKEEEVQKVEDGGKMAAPAELAVKTEKRLVVNKLLLRAYRYFDRNGCNYLKTEDLRRLLHCLGEHLSHKNVKDLVSWAVAESGKSREDRIQYRSFTDKEELVEVRAEEEGASAGAAGSKAD